MSYMQSRDVDQLNWFFFFYEYIPVLRSLIMFVFSVSGYIQDFLFILPLLPFTNKNYFVSRAEGCTEQILFQLYHTLMSCGEIVVFLEVTQTICACVVLMHWIILLNFPAVKVSPKPLIYSSIPSLHLCRVKCLRKKSPS